MYFTTFLLSVSAVFALPTPQSSSSEPADIGFTPGLTIPDDCRTTPTLNNCPARLPDGNALLTSTNIVINDVQGTVTKYPNVLYAGFLQTANGSLSETSTITLFDFPSGQEGKQCRFQLVSDSGDDTSGRPNIYNVWSLDGEATKNTTWFTKPPRNVVVATFLLDEAKRANTTSNEKFLHTFLFGPGEGSSDGTFACPSGGSLAYEVASAVRNRGVGGGMNIGGQSGLGIEIVGLESEW